MNDKGYESTTLHSSRTVLPVHCFIKSVRKTKTPVLHNAHSVHMSASEVDYSLVVGHLLWDHPRYRPAWRTLERVNEGHIFSLHRQWWWEITHFLTCASETLSRVRNLVRCSEMDRILPDALTRPWYPLPMVDTQYRLEFCGGACAIGIYEFWSFNRRHSTHVQRNRPSCPNRSIGRTANTQG